VSPTAERILDAAERYVRLVGIQRLSVNEVARQAGVSRGSVYNHFPDRDALLGAVLERIAARFVAASEPFVSRRRTLAGQVAEAAVFITRHAADPAYALGPQGSEDSLIAAVFAARMGTLMKSWIEFWLPRLADAERRGELRRGLDHTRAAEWIVRVLLTFALVPGIAVDTDDPDAIRSFVRDHLRL
jgi:AcrR family transcriptional regulator